MRLSRTTSLARRPGQIDDKSTVRPTLSGRLSPPGLLGGIGLLLAAGLAESGDSGMCSGQSCRIPVPAGSVSLATTDTRISNNGIITDSKPMETALQHSRLEIESMSTASCCSSPTTKPSSSPTLPRKWSQWNSAHLTPLFHGPDSGFDAPDADENDVRGLPSVGCPKDQLRGLRTFAKTVTLVGTHPPVAGVLTVPSRSKPRVSTEGYEPGEPCVVSEHNQLRVPNHDESAHNSNRSGTTEDRLDSEKTNGQASNDIVQETRSGRESLPEDPPPNSSSPHH